MFLAAPVQSAARLDELEDQLHALYGGHFLAGESAFWALAPRERLRARVLQALERLAETLYHRLMGCHRSFGQTAEALVVYQRCRSTLSSLGVTPSRETESLASELRRDAKP